MIIVTGTFALYLNNALLLIKHFILRKCMLFSTVKRDILYFKKNKSNLHYRKMYLLLHNLIKICQKIKKENT